MFGDFGKIMKLAGEMKRRMPEIREKIAAGTHEGLAGNGAVKAVVGGKGDLIELKISSELLAAGDAAALADLVKAAVSAAQAKAAAWAAELMKELTGGMELPGMEGMIP